MTNTRLGVRAVLQAGGFGRRMRVVSDEYPKHLLCVGGIPMVERLLRQMTNAGLRDIWIIIGYLGEKIEQHIAALSDLPSDLNVQFIRETSPRGDIGAVADLPFDTRPVITAYADLVTNLDFRDLVNVHISRHSDITLASHYESHQVRLGELITDGDRVQQYLEKPLKNFLICSGIAVLEAKVQQLIDPSRPVGLDQLVGLAIASGYAVTHWEHGASWIDVNEPSHLLQANKDISKK